MCSAPSECFFHPRKWRCRLLQVWNGADFVDCRGRCVCPWWKLSIVIYILKFVCWVFFYFDHLNPKSFFSIYILNCTCCVSLFIHIRKSDLKHGLIIFSGNAKDEGVVLFGDLQNLMSFLACYTPIDYSQSSEWTNIWIEYQSLLILYAWGFVTRVHCHKISTNQVVNGKSLSQ